MRITFQLSALAHREMMLSRDPMRRNVRIALGRATMLKSGDMRVDTNRTTSEAMWKWLLHQEPAWSRDVQAATRVALVRSKPGDRAKAT